MRGQLTRLINSTEGFAAAIEHWLEQNVDH
jgi:hypothetical protein